MGHKIERGENQLLKGLLLGTLGLEVCEGLCQGTCPLRVGVGEPMLRWCWRSSEHRVGERQRDAVLGTGWKRREALHSTSRKRRVHERQLRSLTSSRKCWA